MTETLGGNQNLPAINHLRQKRLAALPVEPDAIEHRIAARALCRRLAQRLAPPGEPHLAEHRLLRAPDDPRKAAIKLKRHA
jgi:hypothetical protein